MFIEDDDGEDNKEEDDKEEEQYDDDDDGVNDEQATCLLSLLVDKSLEAIVTWTFLRERNQFRDRPTMFLRFFNVGVSRASGDVAGEGECEDIKVRCVVSQLRCGGSGSGTCCCDGCGCVVDDAYDVNVNVFPAMLEVVDSEVSQQPVAFCDVETCYAWFGAFLRWLDSCVPYVNNTRSGLYGWVVKRAAFGKSLWIPPQDWD